MLSIVGAGAAGLSLAMLVPDAHVYERLDEPGGLCRSTYLDGFTFDQGPHILGGIPEAVQWTVESTGLTFVEGRTRNVGYAHGEWQAHPFEDYDLGQSYMGKMWKSDPRLLTTGGLGAQKGRKPGGVSTFLYPQTGGYQAITDAWAHQLGERVTYGVTCEEGDDIWTGPVEGGRYNTLTTVTIGCEGKPPDLTAIYLPEPWTPFHRLSFPAAFSPANAPEGCYSIQGEASETTATAGDLLDTLGRLGLAPFRRVFAHEETIRHAYPVPVTQPETPRGHGRTGSLRYLNVDGVVAQSAALADKLLTGAIRSL